MSNWVHTDIWGDPTPEALEYDIATKNLLNQQNYNQKIFEREDNAITRRVNDLKRAGLSPTLAAGSAATTVSPGAPQLKFSPMANLEKKTAVFNSAMNATNMMMDMIKSAKSVQATETQRQLNKVKLEQEKHNLKYYQENGRPSNQAEPMVTKLAGSIPGAMYDLNKKLKKYEEELFSAVSRDFEAFKGTAKQKAEYVYNKFSEVSNEKLSGFGFMSKNATERAKQLTKDILEKVTGIDYQKYWEWFKNH